LLDLSHNLHCPCVSPVCTPRIVRVCRSLHDYFLHGCFSTYRRGNWGSGSLSDFPFPVSPQWQGQVWTSIPDPESPCFCRTSYFPRLLSGWF
jgi:hypothetical protein